jgi:hypothetical protein
VPDCRAVRRDSTWSSRPTRCASSARCSRYWPPRAAPSGHSACWCTRSRRWTNQRPKATGSCTMAAMPTIATRSNTGCERPAGNPPNSRRSCCARSAANQCRVGWSALRLRKRPAGNTGSNPIGPLPGVHAHAEAAEHPVTQDAPVGHGAPDHQSFGDKYNRHQFPPGKPRTKDSRRARCSARMYVICGPSRLVPIGHSNHAGIGLDGA